MRAYELPIKSRIRTVRIEEKMGQRTVADLLVHWGYDMTPSAYRNMESPTGRGVKVNKKLINALANVFNCDVEDLVQEPGVWETLPEEPQRSGRQFRSTTTCPKCAHTW